MVQVAEIGGDISPKSVVASGKGLFFAQNMMYRHTVTVYDRSFQLVATIPDTVVLSNYGHAEFQGEFQGAPVEAAFTSDGRYAYVSNYSMYGPGFREGADSCSPASNYPDSFVYRINTSTLQIDQVIRVGAVPKFVAVTPDNKRILVTNWCTYDLSIIDAAAGAEIQRIPIGAYPRGLAVSPDSRVAYVAVMGGTSVATVDLTTFEVGAIEGVGGGPRHLNISPDGTQLYVTLNRDGQVAKVDIPTATVVSRVSTGSAPRSMAIADDGESLYVVNYNSSTVAKVRTSDMAVLQTEGVGYHPIGITHDAETRQIWVATYGGTLAVFQDGSPG
ncbi:MAG TPA: YncE family protein [Acidothermales bacterium]